MNMKSLWDEVIIQDVDIIQIGTVGITSDGKPIIWGWYFKKSDKTTTYTPNELMLIANLYGSISSDGKEKTVDWILPEWWYLCEKDRTTECDNCKHRFQCWTNKKLLDIIQRNL